MRRKEIHCHILIFREEKNSIFLYKFRQNNEKYILISAKLLFLTISHTLQRMQHISLVIFRYLPNWWHYGTIDLKSHGH